MGEENEKDENEDVEGENGLVEQADQQEEQNGENSDETKITFDIEYSLELKTVYVWNIRRETGGLDDVLLNYEISAFLSHFKTESTERVLEAYEDRPVKCIKFEGITQEDLNRGMSLIIECRKNDKKAIALFAQFPLQKLKSLILKSQIIGLKHQRQTVEALNGDFRSLVVLNEESCNGRLKFKMRYDFDNNLLILSDFALLYLAPTGSSKNINCKLKMDFEIKHLNNQPKPLQFELKTTAHRTSPIIEFSNETIEAKLNLCDIYDFALGVAVYQGETLMHKEVICEENYQTNWIDLTMRKNKSVYCLFDFKISE